MVQFGGRYINDVHYFSRLLDPNFPQFNLPISYYHAMFTLARPHLTHFTVDVIYEKPHISTQLFSLQAILVNSTPEFRDYIFTHLCGGLPSGLGFTIVLIQRHSIWPNSTFKMVLLPWHQRLLFSVGSVDLSFCR